MPPTAFFPTEDQIAQVDPDSGPWEVKIAHRQFHYVPYRYEDGSGSGFAYARNGETIQILHYEDLVRGLRSGAFVDPRTEADDVATGPGDYAARPDLIEYVKEHKTDEVLAYAGSDPDLAALLIDAEHEAKPNNGEPRKGVLAGLQNVIDAYMAEGAPATSTEGLTLADHAAAVGSGSEPVAVTNDDEDLTSEEE